MNNYAVTIQYVCGFCRQMLAFQQLLRSDIFRSYSGVFQLHISFVPKVVQQFVHK